MVVDFPAPFGPRKPRTSPVSTVRSSPSRALVRPNVLTRPAALIAVVMGETLLFFHKFVNVLKIRKGRYARAMANDPADQVPADVDPLLAYVERFAGVLTD